MGQLKCMASSSEDSQLISSILICTKGKINIRYEEGSYETEFHDFLLFTWEWQTNGDTGSVVETERNLHKNGGGL